MERGKHGITPNPESAYVHTTLYAASGNIIYWSIISVLRGRDSLENGASNSCCRLTILAIAENWILFQIKSTCAPPN